MNDYLHTLLFWTALGISVAAFGAMLYSLIRHRQSRFADSKTFHQSLKLEIIWAVVLPLLIFLMIILPAVKLMSSTYSQIV